MTEDASPSPLQSPALFSLKVLNNEPDVSGRTEPASTHAIDPICGMSVDRATCLSCERDGTTWYFCCEFCRTKFLNPAHASTKPAPPGTNYFCPMCPGVTSDHPAACPTCGMALEPEAVSLSSPQVEDASMQRDLWRRFLVAAVCTVPVFALAMGPMIGLPIHRWVRPTTSLWLQALLSTPVVLWSGWPFWVIGFQSLRTRSWNMFTLILLGVGAAFTTSLVELFRLTFGHSSIGHEQVHANLYFESAAVITMLVLLGQILEHRARRRTGQAIRELMNLAPPLACVIRNGVERTIPLGEVMPGETLRVRPGETVPVDGTLMGEEALGQDDKGEPGAVRSRVPMEVPAALQHAARQETSLTTIDESMLTGESLAVSKGVGDAVLGGTVNQTGAFLMRAERVGSETLLARIIGLVAKAQRSRAPVQRLADVVASWFVPAVLAVAVVTLVGWSLAGSPSHALTNAVAVLIIACPCALGLATPMAITVGMGRAARSGILFRDAESLEQLGRVKILFLDKTGTLTEGRPKMVQLASLPGSGFTREEVLRLAASIERLSEHPWARAIVEAAAREHLELAPVTDFRAVPGVGVTGLVEGQRIAVGVGSTDLLHPWPHIYQPLAPQTVHKLQQASTAVFVSADDHRIGYIELEDALRETSKEAVRNIQVLDVRLHILTGDRPEVAMSIANSVGVQQVDAGLKPDEKLARIEEYQQRGYVVAMAGDGINDAPALTAANVGISLGPGTDIAKQSAGVILIQPDLRGIATAIQLSRAVMTNIRQNLFFAFAYNGLGVPLAAGVLEPFGGPALDPMVAALAMSLSSLSVIGNALRLNLFNPNAPTGLRSSFARQRASYFTSDSAIGRP